MPLVTSFSPRVTETLRHFSLQQNRAINEASPQVHVVSGRCMRCGYEVSLDYETPADTLRAVTMTHELSWLTGRRCGGQIAFTVN